MRHLGHVAAIAVAPAAVWAALASLRPHAIGRAPDRSAWEARLSGGLRVPTAMRSPAAATEAIRVRAGTARPLRVAAALSAGAGTIHAAVAGSHLAEWPASGVFFILVAVTQMASAFALTRVTGRRLLSAIAILNAAVGAIWLVSRTTGLPVGPEPWTPEAVGVTDALATTYEMGVVVALGAVRRGRSHGIRDVVTPA